ncbi:nuclear transport factor 2 family protein [Phenylobacterium sp.]|uniref:nuclear transport factor 2 family protein n=1 Tax=Phenylobacterium sp. TaxID=1871053 RepID=UPI0030F3A97D
MTIETDLLALEDQFWTGGPEAYIAHADASCLVVFAGMAAVMDRDAIAKTAEKGRWKDVRLTPTGFLQLAPSVAVVAYDAEATRKDGAAHKARVSSTYVKRDDGWKLAAHQQTEIAAEET